MTAPSASRPLRLFLVAGEPSGDALGAALIAGLRQLVPGVQVTGIGGPEMEAAGLQSLFPMEDLAVMGLLEVLPRYPLLRRRLQEAARAILADPPDAVITIDSPGFCLRLLSQVRAARPGLRTIHYVAPSVWAWKPGRAVKMARVVDHVLALLPFEPPLMRAAGMGCDFVGHPAVSAPRATPAEAAGFRAALGLPEARDPRAPLVLVLPGSRRGEVARHVAPFGDALRAVLAGRPGARVVVPTVRGVAAQVAQGVRGWPGDPLVLEPATEAPGARMAAFAAADVSLAASGTVSLELAANRVPMVIAYRMNLLTEAILRRMLLVDTVTLVNLVSETRTVPEFLGRDCRPEAIAPALAGLIDAGARAQRAAMDLCLSRLGEGGEPPGLRAARAVLGALPSRPLLAG